MEDAALAIRDMWVRGAPLIGATAAWGMYLAAADIPARCNMQFYFEEVYHLLLAYRREPEVALDRMLTVLRDAGDMDEARLLASRMARQIAEEDMWANERIGDHGGN